MLTWATNSSLGEIAYALKKDAMAVAKPLGASVVRCNLGPLAGEGWLVLLGVRGVAATECDLVACDGRRIPVWVEAPCWKPQLIGLRGGNPKPQFDEKWRRLKMELFARFTPSAAGAEAGV